MQCTTTSRKNYQQRDLIDASFRVGTENRCHHLIHHSHTVSHRCTDRFRLMFCVVGVSNNLRATKGRENTSYSAVCTRYSQPPIHTEHFRCPDETKTFTAPTKQDRLRWYAYCQRQPYPLYHSLEPRGKPRRRQRPVRFVNVEPQHKS